MAVIQRRRLVLSSASCVVLLLGVLVRRGASEKQEQLFIRVTQHYDTTASIKYRNLSGNNELHAVFTATLRSTAPAGAKPGEMYASTTDYQCSVQGGGSGTISEQDGTQVELKFSYKPKDTPHVPIELARMSEGSYEIVAGSEPGTPCGVDMSSEMSASGNPIERSIDSSLAVFYLGPQVFSLSGLDIAYDSNLKIGSPEGIRFFQQRSGSFDPNSKSFTRTGHASASSSKPLPDGAGQVSTSVSIDYTIGFNQEPEDVEAVLVPDKHYQDWMPEAGEDQDIPKNRIQVQVVLQKKGEPGKKPRAKAKFFKFELAGVSKEPGVCLNWPPQERVKQKPVEFDLKIDQSANAELQAASDGQSATSGKDLQESSVIISSYDWGGWGKLKVSAELDTGGVLVAHLENNPSTTELKIPRDDNGNHIADAWENQIGLSNTNADSDDDDFPPNSDPGDGHSGDGLSLYEEYRGFRVWGGHVRPDPRHKDVFIYDRNNLGVGWFAYSYLRVRLVKPEEFGYVSGGANPRVINFNTSGYAHLGDEHVIELRNGSTGGLLGLTEGGPGVPKNIAYILVDKAACLASKWKEQEFNNTIAHELAHATNVRHHGDGDYYVDRALRFLRFEGSPTPHALCTDPASIGGEVAVQGGECSGELNCIMRAYRCPYYPSQNGSYCLQARDDTGQPSGPFNRGEYTGPTPAPGSFFCSTKQGKGVAGDATRGYCYRQFCVNDVKH